MKKLIILIILMVFTPACGSKRHVGGEYPFRFGFQSLKWGSSVTEVDSMVSKDTTWKKISGISDLNTDGEIVVVKDKQREYYLEFDKKDRFFSMNYMSDKSDLDTVRNRLQKYYGEPDHIERTNENYQQQIWNIDADSVQLEIQILITHQQYSLRVLNKKK